MKKAVSILLSAALTASAVSPAFAADRLALGAGDRSADWPAWAENARDWAEGRRVSDSFLRDPEVILTRGTTAQLLYEAAGKPTVTGAPPFTDVSGPCADAIAWAAQNGYLAGIGGGLYAPDRPVTRQEFAAILFQRSGRPQAAVGGLSPYGDRGQIASWALTPLNWCVRAGLMAGKGIDRLAPTDRITTAEALLMVRKAGELPDLSRLRTDLEALTAAHRPIGSQGEQAAVQYLKERFAGMGYEVTLQPYTDEQGRAGTNVIAVKKAARANADILVLSAHHDSAPTAYGANDNASGVAALLSAAEAMKDVETDTELRFVSFTDEENGKNGSRFYTDALTEKELERMIGDAQFDMMGGLGAHGSMVCTADGQANWVSGLLQKKDGGLSLGAETASDHSSFQLAGVPSVLLMQKDRGYLYHSAADTADQLDLYAIANAASTAVSAVKEVVSPDTASYRTLAREQGRGYAYCQTKENVIYFDSSLRDTEAYIGASGELVDHREVSGNGWSDSYDTYRYSMRWFGGEEPMNTYYEYRNGYLQGIEVRPGENGYTAARVGGLLEAMYGQPTRIGTDRNGNPYRSWQDEIYGKYITLTDAAAGCTVSVSKYAVGISNTLAAYPVTDGQANITDPEDKKVWDLVCSILPEENRKKITQFQLFTDGASNILAYTSPIRDEEGRADNTRFSISIDYYDVYDENGVPRDWSKLTYTILHEYGHVLLEDETQIDLSVSKDTHDPAGFITGSFRKAFYDKFWRDLSTSASAVSDYEKNPTHYVSRYGANYFHEDIADTFAVFLLGGKPAGDTVAEEKLNFFWADADMVALRTAVRENLGLGQREVPQPAS